MVLPCKTTGRQFDSGSGHKMLQLIAKFTFLHKIYSYFIKSFPIFLLNNTSKYVTIKKILYNLNLDSIKGDIVEFGIFTGSSFRHIINIERKYSDDTKFFEY
jgi:hypothetical protein